MSRLLIVTIASKKEFSSTELPKETGERIAQVAPGVFLVFSSRSAQAYSSDLKKKISAPCYVIKTDQFTWDGSQTNQAINEALNKARNDDDPGVQDFPYTSIPI